MSLADPIYLKEFPDYDDDLDDVPGMTDSSWHNDGCPMFSNDTAGFRIWFDYKDPNLSQEPADQGRREGSIKRFSLHKIVDEFDAGKDELILQSDDLDEILTAYAEAWMRWVAVHIGMGFHPDTSASEYEPRLEPGLFDQYDEMIGFAHQRLDDIYAISLDAWEKAGVIEALQP